MADAESEVELGFIEKDYHILRLASPFFPSKVGGKPSWLNLQDIPDSKRLLCTNCQKSLVFLLQIYAPLTDGSPDDEKCFHRALFVFCCKNAKCHKTNSSGVFAVFRNQLPRKNNFYSNNPPPELGEDRADIEDWNGVDSEFRPRTFASLCDVCGCLGDKKCSKCHKVCYCCRDHQVIGWKAGHKTDCSKLAESKDDTKAPAISQTSNYLLFPEFEIVTEPEPEESKAKERSEKERMKDFEKMTKNMNINASELGGKDDKELEKLAMAGKEDLLADKQFKAFKKRIAREPEQVLRYDKGGQPLWVSGDNQPSKIDIPNCLCGASRQFEFQVMPQLLNYLGVDSVGDSIDWGTVAIYTCTKNCEEGPAYHQEFVWKQDFTDTGLPGNALLR